jgi:hypothetical protein
MNTDTLEREGKAEMHARKPKAATATPVRAGTIPPCTQPRYHSEISDEYLNALQRQVDRLKPEGFKLTPVSGPGW